MMMKEQERSNVYNTCRSKYTQKRYTDQIDHRQIACFQVGLHCHGTLLSINLDGLAVQNGQLETPQKQIVT
jgi:hypothetical protein